MANSLETRVPLLDPDVMEFAWSLPLEHLIEYREGSDGSKIRTGKKILRNVLYRHVPKELMDRPKKGFSIPVGKWIRDTELRSWAEDMIAFDKIKREGFLNAEAVWRVFSEFFEGGEYRPVLWYILMFEEWLEKA
jgi:asparagine synthase (glutamine-hydrolysing)